MTSSSPISTLESHTGYWLRFVSNHVSHAFSLKVESHGVTVAEWVVMRALFESDGVNPSQLAASLGMTRGTVSKLVDRLSAKRLILCRAEKADRRFQTLTLTASGKKLVPILAKLADQNDHEFFGHFTEQQRGSLLAMLKDVVARQGLKGIPVD